MTIRTAMILAAGLGTRMRPITDTIPKPLVPVAGKPLIAYGIEACQEAGIDRVVVNVHYLAEQVEDWLAREVPKAQISDERAMLLDSGGGIVKALPLLGAEPFLVLNADTFWLEDTAATETNLSRLINRFDPGRMDILMMTAAPGQAIGFSGKGDFTAVPDGRLARYRGGDAPVIYAGALVLNPAILGADRPDKFSLNACFDEAIARGRLFGMAMAGLWLTVGTPEAIPEAEEAMRAYRLEAAS